jgi:eukaryotic-like serine/threonine-protein kinase
MFRKRDLMGVGKIRSSGQRLSAAVSHAGNLAVYFEPDVKSKLRTPQSTVQLDSSGEVSGSDQSEFAIDFPNEFAANLAERYVLRGEIARGGMGVVMRAYDERLDREVAIKFLRPDLVQNLALREKFFHEAIVGSHLQHPCVVPIYDLSTENCAHPYFVMKMVTGKSLDTILGSNPDNQLERSRLLKAFEQVCMAIAYAHSQGILHLDLKPSNIMIGAFGEVYVMDWGLAKAYNSDGLAGSLGRDRQVEKDDSTRSRSGIRGTFAYMAPEQIAGQTLTPRTDVFGLGALLCEILTGRPPYRGRNQRRVYSGVACGKVDDAYHRLDECQYDDSMIELAKRCLSPRPENRPVDADKVASEVSRYLESALERAESDLCRFFELSPDMFCIASLEGYFLRVNSNFPRVLGYHERKLVSQPFLSFVHPDDVAQTVDVMADLMAGKTVVRFRNRYRRKDGSYVRLEWMAKAVVSESTIFAVARDVSESIEGKRS